MNYSYKVFNEDGVEAPEGRESFDRRKLKDPITISISVEMERKKYEAKKKKYKEPIHEKIYKLFK